LWSSRNKTQSADPQGSADFSWQENGGINGIFLGIPS